MTKRFKILAILLSLSFLGYGCSSTNNPLELGLSTQDYIPESPDSWTLPNGLKVLYRYNDELPVVSGSLYVKGGSLNESLSLRGLASATGSQMRSGGVKGMSPAELDLMLDSMGAAVESGFSDEYGTISFSGLADDFEKVFGLFSRTALDPAFDEARFDLWKKQRTSSIGRRKDSPDTMASMIFDQALYGSDSLMGSFTTTNSVSRLGRGDLQRFHRNFVVPKGAILAVSGDISKERLQTAVLSRFSSWNSISGISKKWPKAPSGFKPGVYLLEKDIEQAVVLVGHKGPKRHSPDFYPLHIFNLMFGYGSFDSLLFNEIRSKLGLAYTVYGGFASDPVSGQLQVYAGTRNDQALKSVEEIIKLIELSKSEAPAEARVESAISSASRNFVFKFATPDSVVTRAALLEMLGFPEGYNENFISRIKSVTQEQVYEVARNRLKDEFVIVIVGKLSLDQVKQRLGSRFAVNKVGFSEIPQF